MPEGVFEDLFKGRALCRFENHHCAHQLVQPCATRDGAGGASLSHAKLDGLSCALRCRLPRVLPESWGDAPCPYSWSTGGNLPPLILLNNTYRELFFS